MAWLLLQVVIEQFRSGWPGYIAVITAISITRVIQIVNELFRSGWLGYVAALAAAAALAQLRLHEFPQSKG